MQKESMDKLKKLGNFIGKIISLLSIVFIVYVIYKLGFDFKSITNWPLFIFVSLLGACTRCITVYIMGSAWADWLRLFAGHKIDTKEALCAYAKAEIGKYLPGNVMHFVERNMFAANLGIGQKKLAAGSIIEIMEMVGVSFVMAILVSSKQLIEAFYQIFGDNSQKVVVIVIVIVIIAAAACLLLFGKKISAIIREYTIGEFLKTLMITMLKYAFVLIILGLIMVVLYAYMGGEIHWNNAALIISGYIIAWVFGFVVPGASGGIGVRELVITFLLGPVVGTEIVVTLSIIHRLITIIGDFLAYIIRPFVIGKRNEND